MIEWCRRALELLGFTPTQREAFLARRLQECSRLASEQRMIVGRVERLIDFRVRMGATSVDVDSLRGALEGREDLR